MTHPYDPREEEKKKAVRDRIARSQVQQMPLAQRQGVQGPGAVGGGNQIANQLLKGVLGGAFGPVGTLFGGLLNKGGKVPMQGYNVGGWLSALWNSNPNRKKAKAGGWFQRRNMGGPLSISMKNPNGYNEGGSVMETPIKKVMDEQKLEQQAVAFERDQQRKQEAHDMAMRQKQQQFAMAQKMKKEAATTNKKPKAPLAKK